MEVIIRMWFISLSFLLCACVQGDKVPGFAPSLLQVACEGSLDVTTRQVAAITFKNAVSKHWEPSRENISTTPAEDKETVRGGILDGIINAPPQIRSQLIEAVRNLVYCDYPNQWPGLDQLLIQSLSSGDETRIYGTLCVIRVICRKYEFKSEDADVQVGENIANFILPPLLQMGLHILAALQTGTTRSVDHVNMLRLILKSFWSCCYMGIPAALVDQPEAKLGAWLEVS